MADLSVEVIGRVAERAALASFCDAIASGPAVLSLEGGAGAGKTTLWTSGVDLARERGYKVLTAQPAAAESGLAFAGLGDLFAGVLDDVLDLLPLPQAEALRVAFLLERGTKPLDERVVGMSLLSTLRALAVSGPVLVAVDDVQWLDSASAAVLAFACRRLRTEPVGVLLARRLREPAPRVLDGLQPLERIPVGPLELEDVHRLLHRRLGLVFPLPVLRRLHAVAGGNPFFTLEVARVFDGQQALVAAGRMPQLPERLADLVAGRIEALPAATVELVAAAAALSQPTLALIVALSGDSEGLRPALVAGIVEIHEDRVRFSHPLLAAAALEAVDPLHYQALLRRLAAVVPDEDERARLLALASDGPDPAVAMALDRAATRAHDRGAIGVAAALCEQARRLTPPEAGVQRDRRSLSAARYHWEAGDMERARTVLEKLVAGASSSAARAESLVELAWVHVFGGDQPGGAALARRALGEMAADSAIRSHALNCVATALVLMLEDLAVAARLSQEAVELAERRGDVVALAENLCGVGYVASLLGRPAWHAALDRAEALGPEAHGWRIVGWAITHRAGVSLWTDRPDEAIDIYRQLRHEALDRGDEGSVPTILAYQAIGEFSAGAWPEAEQTATVACEAATQAGEIPHEAMALSVRAMVQACTGRADEARVDAERALSLAGDRSVALARIHATWALGLIDLDQGRPGDAAGRLGALRARLVAAGVGEPAAIPFAADEVEALVAAGRVTGAEQVVEWLEERGQALDRASALAAAWRGRGLLAAASGAQEAAIEAFTAAVEQSARVAMPFERGRALLQLGAAQRRAKRKREARATLEEAMRGFDALGATPWSRQARDELARISGRRPGDPGLTATERRVAELVAAGRTNKEVAAALFVSRRTVEAHLRQVFRKLGVRSRTELARQALDAPASHVKVQGFHRFEPAGAEVPSAVDADVPPPAGSTSRPGA